MKPVLLLRLILAALLGVVSVPRLLAAEAKSPAFSDLTFPAASARAAAEQKVVLVDFYTTWCAPCKQLDETTWQDAKVIELLQAKAVAVKIDAEQERELAARYKVEAYPTLLVLKADGTEIDRLVGYRPPDKFIEEFSAGLAGKGSAQRAQDALASAVTPEDQVKARYDLGQNLAQQGKDAEALVEFLWCYDEGMPKVPSYAGVRNSFLLSDIMQLGHRYPAARAALVERRDRLQVEFLKPGGRSAPNDLGALNRELGEDEKTLALFDQLPATDKRRAALGRSLLPLLLKAQRYADALTVEPYARMVHMMDVLMAPRPGADLQRPEILAIQRRFMVKWFAEHLEVLAGGGDMDHAKELLAKATAYDNSAEAAALYREHLTRAGHGDLLAAALTPPAA